MLKPVSDSELAVLIDEGVDQLSSAIVTAVVALGAAVALVLYTPGVLS